MSGLSTAEINDFFGTRHKSPMGYVLDAGPGFAIMELEIQEGFLRMGGTVSGPTQMRIADVCMYAAILATLGPVEDAVTTNLNMNFYRRPKTDRMRAECRILKAGSRLVVGDVLLFNRNEDDSVAHAGVTFSLPPGRKDKIAAERGSPPERLQAALNTIEN